MSRRPPLPELHAFEAAARHLSFTRAAAELGVTQGAVSQRIKALEARLGAPLFRRMTRPLALTPDGEALASAVRSGFEQIDVGLQRFAAGQADQRRVVSVSVSPSFAARWLMPRIGRFGDRHPELQVHVTAEDRLVDPIAEGLDLAVRFGRGVYDGLESRLLMRDELFPVCSPALAESLSSPADLDRVTLLFDAVAEADDSGCSWGAWAREAGVTLRATPGPSFNQASLALEAAAEGAGVALGRRSLVINDLARGRLVRPFDLSAPTRYAYFVVQPPGRLSQAAQAFEAWLMDEAARDEGPR